MVLRHAKSAWPEGVADHERPLEDRGVRDAPEAGAWLHAAGIVPDAVLCSDAVRTRETWDLAAEQLGDSAPAARYDERLYAATADELLAVVREAAAGTRTVLLVGHNPGVQELVLTLAGQGAGEVEQVREKFPTCALAVLRTGAAWGELAPGAARLTDFAVPRGPKG
ncbi:histidine phosphatase family protein [Streptomyces sp. A7024]|uniref:Histidine phosphatase family protein n=1 Tax=Streptomyces coryli TaxID=1128680 RepID=A0A6G4U919_9ACTN|nr:histidine phosphatase family protein [Streptomyces coryli]